MSLWHIAWSYLWNRKLTTAMTIISVALGVALISAVLTLREQTQKRFEEEGQAFDLVVGAKGNPLQLVLSTVYFLDAPTGNMALDDFEKIRELEDVVAAFPVSMGDTFKGYRIVGTDRALMDFEWGGRRPYALEEGRHYEKNYEAVIGAAVAQDTGLKPGATFIGTHGFVEMQGAHAHEDKPYTVVGVMERSGTPNDRAIFCNLESVWDIHDHGGEPEECDDPTHDHSHDHGHDHGREITAGLIKLASPALRFEYKDSINKAFNVMAAVPVNEIQKLYEQLLGTAKAVLLAIGYLVVVISSMSILIGLYMSILQRKRDLAVMRALGATRGEIFGAVIIEAFWVTVLGLAAGWALGSVVCYALGLYLAERLGFHVSALSFSADLITAYSAVLLMGLVAGILPAWQAYRTDIARDLAEL
ncbi:MAG: ABC transporter permease [Candidatus Hydrogenedentes bacterium]|nr:ABC transporter permease [Candidatus Hydrogenedentota bacterium]